MGRGLSLPDRLGLVDTGRPRTLSIMRVRDASIEDVEHMNCAAVKVKRTDHPLI